MTLFKLLFLALARWQVRIMFSFLVRKIKERLECPKKSCVADLTWNDHVAKNPWAKSRRSEPEQKRTAFKYWVPISDDDSAWNKASVRWSKGNKKKAKKKTILSTKQPHDGGSVYLGGSCHVQPCCSKNWHKFSNCVVNVTLTMVPKVKRRNKQSLSSAICLGLFPFSLLS